ncbi:MAG: WD40 repeat domain-containing protein [Nostoc sp.]|uniref:WD40 repeat domain-containing protein n=1 Tax=Nostoc sp. TaxID=1180 RepID=UPI002FF51BAA
MNQHLNNENEPPYLNETLSKAQQKAKWQIRTGGTMLALSVVGAIIAGVYANNMLQQAKEAQKDIKLEQQGFIALNQFQNQQIKALLTAMEAGNRLKKLVKDGQPLEKYPAAIPILALQTILDNIHERNQIQKYRDEVYDISFSSDGQRFVTVSKAGFAEVRDLSGKLIAELKGHSDVRSASFSPDEQRILTWSYNSVRIWDLSGKLLSELKNDIGVSKASFTPDGQRILTWSYNGIRIWDLLGKLITQFEVKDGLKNNVIFSPDGQVLAITSQEGIFIRDLSGKLLAKLENPQKESFTLPIASFSPDGRRIITTQEFGKNASIWDFSGKLLKEFKFENGYCAISPGGQHFVCLSFEGDKAIGQIWDSTGNLIKKFELSRIGNVKFSLDGKHIVISSSENTFEPSSKKIIQVLDLSGNKSLPSMKVDLPSLLDSVIVKPDKQIIITVSQESDYLFGGGTWKNVQVWDLSDKQLAKIGNDQISDASFSLDGKHIVTYGYSSKTPFVWDSSGNYLAKLEGIQADTRSANFSPDGKLIVTTSEDKIARVWDLSGKLLTKLEGHQDSVSNASFSPDGQRIITTSSYVAQIWDLSGKLLTTLEQNASKASIYESKTFLENASFSPDGKHILAIPSKFIGGQDKKIFIWDLSGKQLAKLTGTSAAFNPNSQQIVITNGSIASVHDLSGKLLAKLEGHQAYVNSASFSPHREYIVTASSDQTARVWDLSGKLLVELKGHNGEVENASFSSDGQRIMTTSNNTRIPNKNTYIWDLSGRQLAKFENSGKASFSPDGKQIFIVSSGVEVWRVGGLDELLVRGCDWLNDYLASHSEAREELKECQQR